PFLLSGAAAPRERLPTPFSFRLESQLSALGSPLLSLRENEPRSSRVPRPLFSLLLWDGFFCPDGAFLASSTHISSGFPAAGSLHICWASDVVVSSKTARARITREPHSGWLVWGRKKSWSTRRRCCGDGRARRPRRGAGSA